MKFLDLALNCFPSTFFNELTIKCVTRFVGFVKISNDPWKLMIEIGLNSRYFIILLTCDNVLILIVYLIGYVIYLLNRLKFK
jgi:hypothetical protein